MVRGGGEGMRELSASRLRLHNERVPECPGFSYLFRKKFSRRDKKKPYKKVDLL